MFDLKKSKGTFKGLIGENMFKLANKEAILVRFFNKNKFIQLFKTYLNKKQINFLNYYWYSLDAIKINSKEIVLYEIKTKNKYKSKLFFKPKMTKSTHEMYILAKKLGFKVKLTIVEFHENWQYEIHINSLEEKDYCIDQIKKYDRKNPRSY